MKIKGCLMSLLWSHVTVYTLRILFNFTIVAAANCFLLFSSYVLVDWHTCFPDCQIPVVSDNFNIFIYLVTTIFPSLCKIKK